MNSSSRELSLRPFAATAPSFVEDNSAAMLSLHVAGAGSVARDARGDNADCEAAQRQWQIEAEQARLESLRCQQALADCRREAAAREQRNKEELQAARAELAALRRDLADNEQRRRAYAELHQEGQRQAAYLRRQNGACLEAIAILRRNEAGHPPPAARPVDSDLSAI